MGLGDAYQESTDTALRVMAARPLEPEAPKPKHSAWTTLPRAIAAGAAELGGNLMDVAGAYGQVSAAYGQNQLIPDTPQEHKQRLEAFDKLQTEGINWRTDESKPLYSFARNLRPDPLTAGTAENIFFGLTKGLTKAIGSGVALGPVGGAATFGTSEGMTTAEDLAVQGVDQATRTKVGATVGVLNAAGMALPVAGNTLAQTAALVVAGGPGSFVAQQAATRSILENANYHELAQQYDPLDPTGLALATLLPAGFAAWAKGGAIKAAMAGKQKAPEASGPAPTPEQVDALMVHNLTAARDAHDAVTPEQIAKIVKAEGFDVLSPVRDGQPIINARDGYGVTKTGLPEGQYRVSPLGDNARFDEPFITDEAGVRKFIDEQVQPARTQQATHSDPHIASIIDRAEALKAQQPDMPVALREDGQPVRLADELDAIRRQAKEGTADELGAIDAPLLKVAAECFLAMGSAAA